MGSLKATRQLPSVHIPDVQGSVPGARQHIASVWAAMTIAQQEKGDQREDSHRIRQVHAALISAYTYLKTALVQSEPHLKPSALQTDMFKVRREGAASSYSARHFTSFLCQDRVQGKPPEGLLQRRGQAASVRAAGPAGTGWYLNTWRILLTRKSMTLSVSSREQLSRCS